MKRLLLIALAIQACAEDGSLRGVRPKLVLTPEPNAALRFDEAVLGAGDPAPVIVGVENRGEAELVLEAVTTSADAFVVSSRPMRLAPGAAGEIFVGFHRARRDRRGARSSSRATISSCRSSSIRSKARR